MKTLMAAKTYSSSLPDGITSTVRTRPSTRSRDDANGIDNQMRCKSTSRASLWLLAPLRCARVAVALHSDFGCGSANLATPDVDNVTGSESESALDGGWLGLREALKRAQLQVFDDDTGRDCARLDDNPDLVMSLGSESEDT